MASLVKLSSGYYIPTVGLGTWLSQPGQVGNALKIALNNGYRHIDCAHVYQNQIELGEAFDEVFKEGNVKVGMVTKEAFLISSILCLEINLFLFCSPFSMPKSQSVNLNYVKNIAKCQYFRYSKLFVC